MKKIIVALLLLVAAAVALSFAFPEKLLELGRSSERGKAGLEQKSIVIDGETWHYLEGGNAKGQTLVMVHGFGADKDNWTRMAPFIKDGYHLVAMDLPGFGESARHKDWNYAPSQQVPRLHKFLESIGVKQHHIVGNSMGGHIAIAYTAKYPNKVITLGLINNAGIKAPEKSEMIKIMETGVNPLLVESVEDFDRMLDFVFVNPPKIPKPIKRYFAQKAVEHRDFNQFIFEQYAAERGASMESALAGVSQPIFVLWGDQDQLIHVSTTDAMKPLMQNGTTVVLKDVGHAPMIEVPEVTAGHYKTFLEKNGS